MGQNNNSKARELNAPPQVWWWWWWEGGVDKPLHMLWFTLFLSSAASGSGLGRCALPPLPPELPASPGEKEPSQRRVLLKAPPEGLRHHIRHAGCFKTPLWLQHITHSTYHSDHYSFFFFFCTRSEGESKLLNILNTFKKKQKTTSIGEIVLIKQVVFPSHCLKIHVCGTSQAYANK